MKCSALVGGLFTRKKGKGKEDAYVVDTARHSTAQHSTAQLRGGQRDRNRRKEEKTLCSAVSDTSSEMES